MLNSSFCTILLQVIISRPSVIPSKTLQDTQRSDLISLISNDGQSYTMSKTIELSSFSRGWTKVSNSRSRLSFVELRREREAHLWGVGALWRSRYKAHCLFPATRESDKLLFTWAHAVLCSRPLCARSRESETKFVVPSLIEEENTYIVCRERAKQVTEA